MIVSSTVVPVQVTQVSVFDKTCSRFEMSSDRACMLCALVQTTNEFSNDGCPNCQGIFEEAGVSTIECTSPSFEGLIGMCKPNKSWVAKWMSIDQYIPGMYAVKVDGRLPIEVVDLLPYYKPRDGSQVE